MKITKTTYNNNMKNGGEEEQQTTLNNTQSFKKDRVRGIYGLITFI